MPLTVLTVGCHQERMPAGELLASMYFHGSKRSLLVADSLLQRVHKICSETRSWMAPLEDYDTQMLRVNVRKSERDKVNDALLRCLAIPLKV